MTESSQPAVDRPSPGWAYAMLGALACHLVTYYRWRAGIGTELAKDVTGFIFWAAALPTFWRAYRRRGRIGWAATGALAVFLTLAGAELVGDLLRR